MKRSPFPRVTFYLIGCADQTIERLVIGHDRGISNVTSYKSATPLVAGRRALSRSIRNPYERIGTPVYRERINYQDGTHRHIFNSPPRLVSRDKRDAYRAAAAARGVDLYEIASMERRINAMEHGNPFGLPTDDAYISWEARKRRQGYYYLLCILMVFFPFISPLAYRGTFDPALSWYTRGETTSLTPRQKRNVLVFGVAISGLWVCVLGVLITIIINRKMAGEWA